MRKLETFQIRAKLFAFYQLKLIFSEWNVLELYVLCMSQILVLLSGKWVREERSLQSLSQER